MNIAINANTLSLLIKVNTMILRVKRKPIILSASIEKILNDVITAIIFLDKFGILEIYDKQKNVKVNASMSLWRSQDVLSTDNWNITNNDKKMLCKLLRCNRFLAIEKITTENNPKMSIIDEVITILGSTRSTSDIICSNDMYKGN
jgi:hypothetical protein